MRTKRKAFPALLLSLALAALACSRPEASSRITLTGSSTMAPLVTEIGKRYESLHSGVRVDVQMGGSSRGIADARSGLASLGMASRSLDPEESDLHAFPLARDGVCMIVHLDNPIAELSEEQIVAIYTGKISNWKEVGGTEAPITVVHKAEGRATLEVFLKHFGIDNRAVHPDVVIGDNEQAIKTVAGNSDALAYVSIGTASFEARHGTAIRLLPLDGVPADLPHVADGSFPMGRILNFVSAEEPRGLIRDFLDFARSAAVDDLVHREAFVPLSH